MSCYWRSELLFVYVCVCMCMCVCVCVYVVCVFYSRENIYYLRKMQIFMQCGLNFLFISMHLIERLIHSCQQKSIGLKFSKSKTGSDVRYSCHHNSSRFTFSIFAHSCRFGLSSIHYNQSRRVYINRRRQYICLI